MFIATRATPSGGGSDTKIRPYFAQAWDLPPGWAGATGSFTNKPIMRSCAHLPHSEDEDAPSMLTRKLISTSIARQPPSASVSRAPSQLAKSLSVGSLSHAPPSYSPMPRSGPRALSRSTSASFSNDRLSSVDTESVTSVEAPPIGRSRTESNASASSMMSSGSRDSSGPAQSVASSQASQGRTAVPRPLRLPQTAGVQTAAAVRSISTSDSHPPVSGVSKLGGPRPLTRTRTRTLSNPGSRAPANGSVLPRPTAAKAVPRRSVSAAVMAPVRSRSISTIGMLERSSAMSDDTILDFPLPPGANSTPSARGLIRPSPSLNTRIAHSATASPVSPPSATMRTLNTVGTGPRPPRIGTGMVYRSSGYSSYYETSRLSRASVASSGKEVGVV